MATVKHVNFPHPLEGLPPRALPVEESNPDEPKRKWGPRHPRLPWNPMPFMDEYLDELRNAKEREEGYIRMMKVGLSRFATYMATEEGVKHPDAIVRLHIQNYQAYLLNAARNSNDEPLKPSYRQRLLRYLHTWLNWMEEAQYVDENPWYRIKVGTTPKVPKPLSNDEVALLFEAHRRSRNQMSPFAWHRQEVILMLLFSWGLRIHELGALNVQSVDLSLDVVRTKNKGQTRAKVLTYLPELKRCVLSYLPLRAREAADGEIALLVEATHGNRLSTTGIYRTIKNLGERAGIAVDQSINPHRMRDTFGTTMANAPGVELKHVQVLMGHSSITDTIPYTEVYDATIARSHAAVMGPKLTELLDGTLDLPEGIDEPPAGWPAIRPNSTDTRRPNVSKSATITIPSTEKERFDDAWQARVVALMESFGVKVAPCGGGAIIGDLPEFAEGFEAENDYDLDETKEGGIELALAAIEVEFGRKAHVWNPEADG